VVRFSTVVYACRWSDILPDGHPFPVAKPLQLLTPEQSLVSRPQPKLFQPNEGRRSREDPFVAACLGLRVLVSAIFGDDAAFRLILSQESSAEITWKSNCSRVLGTAGRFTPTTGNPVSHNAAVTCRTAKF
jgi:hypothetical protein